MGSSRIACGISSGHGLPWGRLKTCWAAGDSRCDCSPPLFPQGPRRSLFLLRRVSGCFSKALESTPAATPTTLHTAQPACCSCLRLYSIAAAAYFPIVSWMLRRLGRLSRSTLVLLSAAVAVAFGVVFAVDGLSFGGLPDAAIAFLVASVSSFASVALGSLVWWRLGPAAQQDEMRRPAS